jgi:hypothetical protein
MAGRRVFAHSRQNRLQIVACTFVGTIGMDFSWFAKDGAFSSFNLIQFQKGDAACH